MKAHLPQTQILLLQRAGNAGKLRGEQRTQVALFAGNLYPYVIAMDGGANFHAAKFRGGQTNAHLRLTRLACHLCHLQWAGGGRSGSLGGCRKAGMGAIVRHACGSLRIGLRSGFRQRGWLRNG